MTQTVPSSSPSTVSPSIVYRGEHLRAVALPLGGIGTGSVALCGDGSLRQWQVCNNVNHLAFVPHSFFAARVVRKGTPVVARVLQSGALYKEEFAPIPAVNDYVVPEACKRLLDALPGVRATEFRGQYPIAEVRYLDEALPVEISLTAYSPFCPLDAQTSGLPAVIFRFTAHNPGDVAADVQFAATLQNCVGWDGVQEIQGVRSPLYGGNENHLLRLRGLTAVTMENTLLPAAHPKNGSLCLAALHDGASVCVAWDDLQELWSDFAHDGAFVDTRGAAPTPKGRTINGALSVPLRLEPGESKTATFVLAWYFPNRYVEWQQGFSGIEDRKSLFWLGNAYNTRFAGAAAVAEYVRDDFDRLDSLTHRFRSAFFDSTLPSELLDTVSSQMSIIRTPTCIWTEDGRFHAFEGCSGASTGGWQATGGCCPLNCTHVWNYEMALAALFPDLERTMRETDLFHQLHPSGYLPHRVTLPLYLPRPWERGIGGPHNPALDGLLGMVLKTYREHRRCGDAEWLQRAWPAIRTAMHHIMTVHDTQGDGVIRGEQPNTYDISIFGPNTFIGTLYLAALRAAEEMAKLQGEPELAEQYRQRYEQGRRGYDELLWNGEYWIQVYDAQQHPQQNWGIGCHSDHLFGQWWAHVLGLGYVLPQERVETALGSILKYNLREDFVGHKQIPRVFASDDEPGILLCSWPHGGRPAVPTLYSDEIWTGIEYEIAALCLYEGRVDDGLKILRAVRSRYDGTRRSPWNDVECGDHYARAMSSWALLDAAAGYQYDAASASLTIAPRLSSGNFRAFFITATAWGAVTLSRQAEALTVNLEVAWGEAEIRMLTVLAPDGGEARVTSNGTPVPCDFRSDGGSARLRFTPPVHIPAQGRLDVLITGQTR